MPAPHTVSGMLHALAILDPARHEDSLPEDSDLALPERTSVTLMSGEVLVYDLYQISAGCWTAKNADHDSQTGVGETAVLAVKDLIDLCADYT